MNPATPHASQTNILSSLCTPPLHLADWCKAQKVKRPLQLVHVQRLLHNGQAAHSQPSRPTYMRSNKLAKMPSCWVPLLGGQGVEAEKQVTGSVQSRGHPPPTKKLFVSPDIKAHPESQKTQGSLGNDHKEFLLRYWEESIFDKIIH